MVRGFSVPSTLQRRERILIIHTDSHSLHIWIECLQVSQKTHPFNRTYGKHRTLEAFVSRTLFYTTHQHPLSETLESILEQFPWKAADGTSSTRHSSNKFVKKAKQNKSRFHTTIFVACTQTLFHSSFRSSFFSKTLASLRAKRARAHTYSLTLAVNKSPGVFIARRILKKK